MGDVTVGQTEYRFRGDATRVAFTESTFRLSTDTNNPSAARSMVDVAEARHWPGVRVSGNADFKRLVWLEASLRGVRVLGHEPQLADQELLKREREARAVNRVEPVCPLPNTAPEPHAPGGTAKQSARGNGGRKAVLAALEAVLLEKGVRGRQREAVMAAAQETLARRQREGQTLKVKVVDPKAAPARAATAIPNREVQRTPERGSPTR
jgi:hypothetical protein